MGHQLQPQQQQYHPARLQPALVGQLQHAAANMINNDQPAPSQSGQTQCGPNGLPRPPEGAPEIEQPVSTVLAVLGRQLVLPLRFCCSPGPARVFWIHRHLAMIPGRMFGPYITRDIYTAYNSFSCYESTFEIDAVKPEDIGTVYVFVSNEKGHAGAQIHIQLAKQAHSNNLQDHLMANQNHQQQQPNLATRFHLLTGSLNSGASLNLNWIYLSTLVGLSALMQIIVLVGCPVYPSLPPLLAGAISQQRGPTITRPRQPLFDNR